MADKINIDYDQLGKDVEYIAHQDDDPANDEKAKILTATDIENLAKVAIYLERIQVKDYVNLVSHTRRWARVNFIAGLMKGLGFIIGVALLGAMLILFLQYLIRLNLPLISHFLVEVLTIVENTSQLKP